MGVHVVPRRVDDREEVDADGVGHDAAIDAELLGARDAEGRRVLGVHRWDHVAGLLEDGHFGGCDVRSVGDAALLLELPNGCELEPGHREQGDEQHAGGEGTRPEPADP